MKIRKLLMATMTLLLFACLAGCTKPAEIVLTFDKNEAYFTSEKVLFPIRGDALSADDSFEQATVVLRADTAAKMGLCVQFEDENMNATGIKVVVDEGQAVDFQHDTMLYVSETAETEATVIVKIYLAKDAPESLKGKTLEFSFVLMYSE